VNYCIECRADIPTTEENEGVYLCATCAREHDTPAEGKGAAVLGDSGRRPERRIVMAEREELTEEERASLESGMCRGGMKALRIIEALRAELDDPRHPGQRRRCRPAEC